MLKGYRTEELKKSLAFSLLAAYHSYVFFAAALSILTLSGNLILAWFISWFQEVRNSNAGTSETGNVSLGFYLAVLTRCWLLIQLSAEVLRCVLWLVEDTWQLQTFQTYRQILTGYASKEMQLASEEMTAAQSLAVTGRWKHSSSCRWWLDLVVQVCVYGSLDVIPLVMCIPPFMKLDLTGGLSTLFATACSIALLHSVLLYVAWVLSDLVAKIRMWKTIRRHDGDNGDAFLVEAPADVEDVEVEVEEEIMAPAHVCALFGGVLHLGWVAVLKSLVFIALLVLALQRDVISENPFWLIAALLLGIAFWHSTLARGLQILAKCCGRCGRSDSQTGDLSGASQQALHGFLNDVQSWADKNAGMSVSCCSQRYDLVVFVLLLQIALFGNFRWTGGAVFLLFLVMLLLLRRSTLMSLGRWRGLAGVLESLLFVLVATLLNAAYSAMAGLGVLVMAVLLQLMLARRELRAWRTLRGVTLGLHTSLVIVVAICMWSMQGGSGWTPDSRDSDSKQITEEYPFCHLRWPLGKTGTQEMSLMDFADMCALTNLDSADFNSSLQSRFPGWTLEYEHRAGETHVYGYNDWTTFFELADPSNETTIFAIRGTQSPLDVMQDLNIFTPVAVTQIASFFGPDLTSSVTKTVFSFFAGLPTIDKDFFEVLLKHVRGKVNSSPDRRFYLTGHSLGGGLAKLVALEVGRKSVTFASPGLRYTSEMLLSKETAVASDQLLAAGDRLGTVVVPEHDLVSRVDQQLGAELGIACDKNPLSCHTLTHIIWELHQGCKSFFKRTSSARAKS